MKLDETRDEVPGAEAIIGAFTSSEGIGSSFSTEQGDAESKASNLRGPSGINGGRNPFISISRALCDHHRRQWEAEDHARQSSADAETLAAIKRTIDTMNMRRSGLIEELDAWVGDQLPQDRASPLHTETLGSVIDRLCIAWVRSQKLRLKNSDSLGPTTSRREIQAERQLAELADAYDTLLAEILDGKRQVPDWRLLKSYG